MKKVIMMLAIYGLLFGCATAPQAPAEKVKDTIAANKNEVWVALSKTLTEKGFRVKTVENTSGIMQTENMGLGGKEDLKTYSNCKSAGIMRMYKDPLIYMNIMVEEIDKSTTELDINAYYSATISNAYDGSYIGKENCNTNGAMEKEIITALKARLNK